MTPHRMPALAAGEELPVGWICAVCAEWIPVVDAGWSPCPGKPAAGLVGVLDRDSTLTGETGEEGT